MKLSAQDSSTGLGRTRHRWRSEGDHAGDRCDLLVAEMVLLGHPHGLGLQDAAMLAGAVIQPHPDEAHVVADRAVEPVAAHVDFRIGRQLEIHRRQRAVGIARHGCLPACGASRR